MANKENEVVVSIDGPAGSGKSTLALYLATIIRLNGIDCKLESLEMTQEEMADRMKNIAKEGLPVNFFRHDIVVQV